jgi:hypothetical protein
MAMPPAAVPYRASGLVHWRKAVIGQNANVSKVPNSEHVLVGKDVSCTG